VNGEAWIVLGVGVATVAAQYYTAHKAGLVAERQARAAEAQTAAANVALERELSARLVATRGGYDISYGDVTIYNGGQHGATEIEVACVDENGEQFASGWAPAIGAGAEQGVRVHLGTVELRTTFERCSEVDLTWTDGRGRRGPEHLPLRVNA
jgi:hypothetical protein